MSRIRYIKSDIFFAKEYNDGIIVAFKKVGDNSPRYVDSINQSFADQIHNVVSKNFGADLFVSDIVDSISGTDGFKSIIRDSLYIYVKHGVSISACGIHSCPNKDSIEVKYNSENILTIKKKRLWKFWSACIFVLLCVWCYNIIFDDVQTVNDPVDEPSKEIQEEKSIDSPTSIVSVISDSLKEELPAQVEDSIGRTIEEIEPIVAENNELKHEVVTIPTTPNDFILIPTGTLIRYFAGYDDNGNNLYENFALNEFYICKHEVTQKEYMQVMGGNPSFIKGNDLPVNAVQYLDAIKYCNARSETEGYDGFYVIDNNTIRIKSHSNGYRLPNRQEWVYAARKDESTKTEYASGNNISQVAWYGGNSKNTLHAVCTTKKPNGRGIYDMNGNVSEWLWEKDFQRCNCHIGGDFLSYVGFYEKDVVGSTVCSEENGFRVVLITKEQNNNNVEVPTSVKYHKLDYYHAADVRIQSEKEDAERERQRKALKAEAKENIRIADKAYAAYVENFDEAQGAVALTNYRKALDLAKKHGLFAVSKMEKIEQSINALEKELK